ncbi:MAG TPA: N-acetylmuramoyl-L-alanine amidase [Victivallales bacterium]|nr:N-acetylmuramoyl-L-alanine amidase [Victivallales bacterium]
MNYKIIKYTAFCCLFVLFTFNLNAKNIRSAKRFGRTYVYLRDVAKYYGMSISIFRKYALLKSRYSNLEFNYDSRTGNINRVKVNFSFAPIYNNGNPLISRTDFLLLINPILNSKSLKRSRIKTIVIDPGHGGKDNGAEGNGAREKSITLSIARKLAKILSAKGYKIIMTRNRDVFLQIKDRPKVNDRFGGDLFISIHCNAATPSASGIETFILAPAGASSTHSSKKVSSSENGNSNDKYNALLGYEIQKSLLRTGRKDRGLKHARFAVLKYSHKPAVLIETGFLSNSYEGKLLTQTKYQNLLAQLITNGILKYIRAVK